MMEPERVDDGAADASMISNNSPYQPTTEPVSNRAHICAGFILDTLYVKSLPGVLKLIQILFCIVVLICLGSAMCGCSGISFLSTVAIGAMIFTIILYVCFALCFNAKLKMIHWSLTDLINAVLDGVFFLIASITLAAQGGNPSSTAAVVFGFFNTVAYAGSAWMAYRAFVIDRHKRHSNVTHIRGEEEQ